MSTNLNRNKSQSQPAVKKTSTLPRFKSLRNWLWKNSLKRTSKDQIKTPHKEQSSNRISSRPGLKRLRSTEFLDSHEKNALSEDDEEIEDDTMTNEVEMEDDDDEDWDKEIEKMNKEKIKNNPKKAWRRKSSGNLLDLEPNSEQLEDQNFHFPKKYPYQDQRVDSPNKTSNLIQIQQNKLSKSVDEFLGGYKGHHQHQHQNAFFA